MTPFYRVILICCATALPSAAIASEARFLASIEGRYQGRGEVRLRTNKAPIIVSCTFDSTTTATSLTLEGRCRGLVIFSRSLGADLSVRGSAYRGSYVGAGSGPASLTGRRRGETLHLSIRWAKAVNGDRSANLAVARVAAKGLRLTTTDKDPRSGKTVVTSEIVLRRK